MNFSSLFSFTGANSSHTELPELFPLPIIQRDFIINDVVNIYAKILTDVVERTQGIKDENLTSFWDNCLASENNEGLITMLSKAMSNMTELFIVYDSALKLLIKANNEQMRQIKDDYAKSGSSNVGTYISFKNYKRTEMVKIYSALEYCAIGAMNKNMHLSNAIQLKMSDVRGSIALSDKSVAEAQAKSIADGLASGKSVLLDAKDKIETATPQIDAIDRSMEFINERRSFYLGLPASYITGVATKGMSDTGEGDSKAVERGLKNYYFSIIKPVIESVFKGTKTSFKSEDFRQIESALNTLKTFELTSDEYLGKENKTQIVNKLFGLPDDEVGDEVEEIPQPQPNPTLVQ